MAREAVQGFALPLPEGTKVLKDLAYVPGGHERQKLDLYLPPGPKPWPPAARPPSP